MDTINGYDEKEIKNTFVLIALYQAILSRTEMNGEASTNTKHGKKIQRNFLESFMLIIFKRHFCLIQFNKRFAGFAYSTNYMLVSADPFTRYMNIWLKGSH